MATPKTFIDVLTSFEAGVNGGIEPLLLPKNQLASGDNISVRGAYVTHRPPILNREFFFASPVDQATVENGLFQGAGYYRPDYGTEQLIAQISGHLFSFTEVGDKFTVADISIAGDLNSATAQQVWMWQAEKWMIISDGTGALPIFYDGTVSRRSYGPSVPLGTATVFNPIKPPAIGGIVTATLNADYTGPFGVPVLLNGEYYEPTQNITGAYSVILTNVSAVPGATMPIGSNLIVHPGFIGTIVTGGTDSSNIPYPGSQRSITVIFDSVIGLSIGSILMISNPLPLGSYGGWTVMTIDAITKSVSLKTVNLYVGSNPPTTIVNGQLATQTNNLSPNFPIGFTTATFVVPAVGGSVSVEIDTIYLGASNQSVFIGTEQYIIASAPALPSSSTLYLTNLTDTGTADYIVAPATSVDILSVPELPAGRMGAYGMGRVAMSLVDGISFIYGDIVNGASGTPANSYRDSVLKTTELTFQGGAFRLPGSGDIITAMIFPTVLDASLGQGSLQVGTANSMFSCNVPSDSTLWATLQTPILTQSLKGKGPLGQNSTILANSDILFREFDGLGTLIQARRDFTQSGDTGGGNTPISREVSYIFDYDTQELLPFSSAMTFDNRFLTTHGPKSLSLGIVHDGLVGMNFDTVSNLRTKLPPVYEGRWVGLNVLQAIFGQVNGTKRGFVFAVNTLTNKIELHEFLSSQNTVTMDLGSIPINWQFDTPIMFNKDIKPINELVKLTDGEIYTKDISGPVDIEIQYRPDFNATWTSWHRFTIDSITWKPRMGLGLPSHVPCESVGGRPMRVGYFFQFRAIIRGHIKFMGLRAMATLEQQTNFANPICNVTTRPTTQPVLADTTPPPSSDCVNVIPIGAVYDDSGFYYLNGTDGSNPTQSLLEFGATYLLTMGNNETSSFNAADGHSYPKHIQNPVQFIFSGPDLHYFYLISSVIGTNVPVTATVCKVSS